MVALLTPSGQLNWVDMRRAVFRQCLVYAVWHMLVKLFCDATIFSISMLPCRQGFQGLHGKYRPFRPMLWQRTLL